MDSHRCVRGRVPVDVADVVGLPAAPAGASSRQFLHQDILAEGDIENAVHGQYLEVGVQLSTRPGEPVEDHALCRRGERQLLLNDLAHDLVRHQPPRHHDLRHLLHQTGTEAGRHIAPQYLADLVPGRHLLQGVVLCQQLRVSALACSWRTEHENKLLVSLRQTSRVAETSEITHILNIFTICQDTFTDYKSLMKEELMENRARPRYRSLVSVLLMAMNVSLSSFYFGYTMVHLAYIPFSTIALSYDICINWSVAKGLLNACVPSGALVGSLSAILFLKKLSRRNCLLVCNALAICFGTLIVVVTMFPVLVVGRLGQGFCVGLCSSFAPLLIKEQTPLELYKITGTFHQISISLGVFVASFFVYVLGLSDPSLESAWRYVIMLTLAPLLLQTVVLLSVFRGETVKYHLLRNEEVQARSLVSRMYRPECLEAVLLEKKNDIGYLDQHQQPSIITTNEQLIHTQHQNTKLIDNPHRATRKKLWLPVLLGMHLSILQQFSGMNAVTSYGGAFASESFPSYRAIFTWLLNLDKLIGAVVSLLLLRRLGRKTIIQAGSLLAGTMNCMVGIGTYVSDKSTSTSLIFFGLFAFMMVYGCTLGSVIFVYLPEVVEPYRMPVTQIANWAGAICVIFLFPVVKDLLLDGNPGAIFFFFGVWCLSSYFLNQVYLVESKDKREDELWSEFAVLQHKFK